MAKQFVWILDAGIDPYLQGSGGISFSYVLPGSQAPDVPESLAGANIVVCLRGVRGDLLFALIRIAQVERFEDGLNAGDYLLTVSPFDSFRCVRSYDEGAESFSTSEFSAVSSGLHEITEKIYEKIKSNVVSQTIVRLKPPSEADMKRLAGLNIGLKSVSAKSAMESVLAKKTLEELWANSNKPKLPPFAHFAYRSIEAQKGEEEANKWIKELSALDPTVKKVGKNADTLGETNDVDINIPTVDLDLKPIDPDRLYARKFIARDTDILDLESMLEKTEHAEKRHQDMLRDIVIYLQETGLTPMQSSSIDLFVKTADKTSTTFEIKTTTKNNVLAQAAKGLFQLGCYAKAMKQEGFESNSLVLVMEDIFSDKLNAYVYDVLKNFGICVLFYDGEKSWPDKLPGLIEKLE